MQNKDQIIKFLAYEGKVSFTLCLSTDLVEKARQLHDLSPAATAALGRMLTMAAMMGANLKSVDDTITIQMKGNGPIGNVLATTNYFPKVKGYVSNPLVDIPLKENGKIDVSGAVGKEGFLYVIKDIGLKEPYIGTIPIISGEIAEDFVNYFAVSEQTPSAIALGVLVDQNGVKTSGGYLLTPMPDCSEEIITKIEQNLKQIKPISQLIEEQEIQEIAKLVTGDKKVQIIEENVIPVYECDCSKERIKKGIQSLGEKEIKKIIQEDQKAEVICHFCNQKYLFSKEELEEMI